MTMSKQLIKLLRRYQGHALQVLKSLSKMPSFLCCHCLDKRTNNDARQESEHSFYQVYRDILDWLRCKAVALYFERRIQSA